MKLQVSKALSQYSLQSNIFSLKDINSSHTSRLHISLDLTPFCRKQLKQMESGGSNFNLIQQQFQRKMKVQAGKQDEKAVEGKRKVRFLGNIFGLEQEYDGAIFQRLMDNNLAKKPNQKVITIARPGSNYCQICGQNFEDYLKHIQHISHKNKCQKTCKTSKNIKQLLINTEYYTKRPCSEKYIRDSGIYQQDYRCSSKVRIISNERTQTPMPIRLEQPYSPHYALERQEQIKRCNKSIQQQNLQNQPRGLARSNLLLLS